MIQFLKRKKETGASLPVDTLERKPDVEEDMDFLHGAAEELLQAIESKDAHKLAIALKAAIEICDAEHVKGE